MISQFTGLRGQPSYHGHRVSSISHVSPTTPLELPTNRRNDIRHPLRAETSDEEIEKIEKFLVFCRKSSNAGTKADGDEDPDKLAWNVTDREIFEWQYVCRTGRPYWCVPDLEYSRLKKLPGRLWNESPPQSPPQSPPHLWMREVDRNPKELYSKQRRTVSDSYLADQDRDDDNLAHLIAIQLLSSCFTLPPDQNGLPWLDFNYYNPKRSPRNLPDPRLISSLRMHTYFRYSPCFGHQARNTSPVRLWSASNDRPSPTSSLPYLATGFHTPVIGSSGSSPRGRRVHRPVNGTEGSANGCSPENQSEEIGSEALEDNAETIWGFSTLTTANGLERIRVADSFTWP
ncbi:hypothetical protein D0Z07_7018 [Hyphodiscus hymeniophilus]|uniref:Uncharacterized protein n=1 Tax=Hyphodiscus hymeniophilus TaxID=353542 RepID=A0A9P6VG13_9HELO|nr:hypothetical protein D0Z07_7018 [Hyphodiscus hymeniophilus]